VTNDRSETAIVNALSVDVRNIFHANLQRHPRLSASKPRRGEHQKVLALLALVTPGPFSSWTVAGRSSESRSRIAGRSRIAVKGRHELVSRQHRRVSRGRSPRQIRPEDITGNRWSLPGSQFLDRPAPGLAYEICQRGFRTIQHYPSARRTVPRARVPHDVWRKRTPAAGRVPSDHSAARRESPRELPSLRVTQPESGG